MTAIVTAAAAATGGSTHGPGARPPDPLLSANSSAGSREVCAALNAVTAPTHLISASTEALAVLSRATAPIRLTDGTGIIAGPGATAR